jgi:hypothetical protein
MEIITGKYTIKQIFKDHWPDFLRKHRKGIPDYVIENVEKILNCRDSQRLGYHKYSCKDHPDQIIVVPHSCKSRFCNSCGKIMADQWTERAFHYFPDVPFYHITFTISDKLRSYFYLKAQLRNLLFEASAETVLGWFKKRGILPAIVSVFHNHGRDGKNHPHLHLLVSAGGLDLETKKYWLSQEYLPWRMLKIRWKVKLLWKLKDILPKDLKEFLFNLRWYVNVGIRLINARATIHYIGRYTKKPVIAETRILDYDGQFVSFVYQDFRSDSEVKWTLPVEKFISLLIQHIPPKQFRTIRYYGLLASRTRRKWQSFFKKSLFLKPKMRILSWRERQIDFRKKDPLICPLCQKEMVLREIAFRGFFGELVIIPVN